MALTKLWLRNVGTLGDVNTLGAVARAHDLLLSLFAPRRAFGNFLTRPVMVSIVFLRLSTRGREEKDKKLGASFESAHSEKNKELAVSTADGGVNIPIRISAGVACIADIEC